MGVYGLNLAVKGPACKALDAISSNPAAMTKLQTALAGISGAHFAGLENVLANDLLPAANYSASQIATIKAALKEFWFDPNSPTTYFPGLDVAGPYGEGVMKVLEIALGGPGRPGLPIDAWWFPNHPEIDMLNLISLRQVTLVIATPKPPVPPAPQASIQPVGRTIGFSTRLVAGQVLTEELKTTDR